MTMIEMTFWKKMFGRLFCLDKAHYPIVFYASYIQIIFAQSIFCLFCFYFCLEFDNIITWLAII